MINWEIARMKKKEDCHRCQGNGELLEDWDRYLAAEPGDKGDESVPPCPDCLGTGKIREFIQARSPR